MPREIFGDSRLSFNLGLFGSPELPVQVALDRFQACGEGRGGGQEFFASYQCAAICGTLPGLISRVTLLCDSDISEAAAFQVCRRSQILWMSCVLRGMEEWRQ